MARSEEPETRPKSPVASSAARRKRRITLAQGYGISSRLAVRGVRGILAQGVLFGYEGGGGLLHAERF